MSAPKIGYCTKYWATRGIFEVGVMKLVTGSPPHRAKYVDVAGYWGLLLIGKDFFYMKDDAEEAVRGAIDRKIIALKKQVAKFEKMKKDGPKWEKKKNGS